MGILLLGGAPVGWLGLRGVSLLLSLPLLLDLGSLGLGAWVVRFADAGAFLPVMGVALQSGWGLHYGLGVNVSCRRGGVCCWGRR